MRTDITRCRNADLMIITVQGRVDGDAALRDWLTVDASAEATSPHVILDLSHVPHFHPDAVGPLIDAYWRVTNRGARFSVVAPHQRVRMAMMLHALDWLIPLCHSIHEAELDTTALLR